MIAANSKVNINSTKELMDTYNTQMTDQKKIDKPSEDPVVAIRSLRLRSTLSDVKQYAEKNIPDAQSWLDVTETALKNMSQITEDLYKQCVNGSNDTLTAEDRNVLSTNLASLKDQYYAEGNADYAGRTIFTGYKTNTSYTFGDDSTTPYEITQEFDISAIKQTQNYTNSLSVPTSLAEVLSGYDIADEMVEVTNDTMSLGYGNLDASVTPTILVKGVASPYTVTTTAYSAWQSADFAVPDDEILFIPETGQLAFGANVSSAMKTAADADPDWNLQVTYDKASFSGKDVRPEMLYTCTSNPTDPVTKIDYTIEKQDIEYTVSQNQNLKVNTQAEATGLLSTDIGRSVDVLSEAVDMAVKANDKVDIIKDLMKETQYSSDEAQAKLGEWLTAAKREQSYADEHVQKLFSRGMTSFQDYKEDVELEVTDVGSRGSRLELTKSRMDTQKTTVTTLISNNEDREISDILLDYKSSYTAYQSALQAASKVKEMSLLDYL